MKSQIFLFTVFCIFLLFWMVFPVHAQTFQGDKTVTLPKNEVIDADYFAAGESIVIDGTIHGDAYIAGGSVMINGTIQGDVLIAGGTVTVDGTVEGNVRGAGGNVTISGNVGRNTTIAGGQIHVSQSAVLSRNLTVAGGMVTIDSPIPGDLVMGAGQAVIGNTIGGNVTAGLGQLSMKSGAHIAGNLTYWSESESSIAHDTVAGTIGWHKTPDKRDLPEDLPVTSPKAKNPITSFAWVLSFLTALVLGALFLKFFPHFSTKTTECIVKRPFRTIGIGFLMLAVLPFGFILLCITIVGIPIAIFAVIMMIFSLYLAKIFVALAMATALFRYIDRKATQYVVLFAGLVIYYFLTAIPVIGGLVWIISMLSGVGALYITKKWYYSSLQDKI